MFPQLLFRRGTPVFLAFDLLWLDGHDLRRQSLLTRKRKLRQLLPEDHSPLLYLDHLERNGIKLFCAAQMLDLEGIVAKPKDSAYVEGAWLKIRNPLYSQMAGRHELFENRVSMQRVWQGLFRSSAHKPTRTPASLAVPSGRKRARPNASTTSGCVWKP